MSSQLLNVSNSFNRAQSRALPIPPSMSMATASSMARIHSPQPKTLRCKALADELTKSILKSPPGLSKSKAEIMSSTPTRSAARAVMADDDQHVVHLESELKKKDQEMVELRTRLDVVLQHSWAHALRERDPSPSTDNSSFPIPACAEAGMILRKVGVGALLDRLTAQSSTISSLRARNATVERSASNMSEREVLAERVVQKMINDNAKLESVLQTMWVHNRDLKSDLEQCITFISRLSPVYQAQFPTGSEVEQASQKTQILSPFTVVDPNRHNFDNAMVNVQYYHTQPLTPEMVFSGPLASPNSDVSSLYTPLNSPLYTSDQFMAMPVPGINVQDPAPRKMLSPADATGVHSAKTPYKTKTRGPRGPGPAIKKSSYNALRRLGKPDVSRLGSKILASDT